MEVEQVKKEDLDLKNHLIGLQQPYIKLSFLTTSDLQKVTPLLSLAFSPSSQTP